jgi:hypothetical protein
MIYKILLLIIIIILLIILYGYNSGSCQIKKNYKCDENFCLFKEFKIHLSDELKNEINNLILNTQIHKRVDISMYPETIFNCAIPNKRGVTISTQNIVKHAQNLITYYQNDLCDIVSKEINLKLFPTDLSLPTSCSILIYENEGDWINWHYDYNYYDGRFFTVLIPITNDLTCTEFQYKDNDNNIKSIQLVNGKSICFEGNYLYHRASKLCNGQNRILLSCQYVTINNMSFVNKLRLRIKDYAYIGLL